MDRWTKIGTTFAALIIAQATINEICPDGLRGFFARCFRKIGGIFSPYVHITFPELSGGKLKRNEAYSVIQNYLSAQASAHAKRLKADLVKDSQAVVLAMDDHEEVSDLFGDIEVRWFSGKSCPKAHTISFQRADAERRFYTLSFHKCHRDIITTAYIPYVLKEGKAIAYESRQRKLYTNNPSESWYDYKPSRWSHVPFEHPASFETLAMAAKKKDAIMKDLVKFSQGERYYKKIGKPWKRGYLLYGPPGTGKSTMIAAMANFLNYDVYDLELTTVKDNSELRLLLIETSKKALIVIEDIDCSLDLTGQRVREKELRPVGKAEDLVLNCLKEDRDDECIKKSGKVTLSGLLNFIDGIWSACGGEKIIVFTTNYVDKLDPALIRRGRMDKHIEMTYCSFEAFKVLAKNYLDVECHELFGIIEELLGETKMTPADVAENLMPKSDEDDEDSCLENLIEALEAAKVEEAKLKFHQETEEAILSMFAHEC